MKPSELATSLELLINCGQPVCIWGEPGIGKSNVVHQVTLKLLREMRDVRAVLLDAVDVHGLPHVNGGGRVHWAIPEFLPRDGTGVLFLDELNRAPMLVQNALFQLVLDRKIGEYILPDGWQVVAACNPDGGGVTKMSPALCNRFVHLTCEPDLDDWCKWAVAHNIEPAVIAFLRFRSELLHKFSRTDKAFPSPRSWEFVSKLTAQNPPDSIAHSLFCGTVGDGAAVEYSAFVQLYRNIPSIDGILLNPKTAPVPQDNPASLFAVGCALGRRANASNLQRIVQYLDRLPEEYNVMAIKDAVGRDASLCTTSEFTKWAIAHSDVVF